MKTLSIRELRNRPGAAQSDLDENREIVLTAHGRPVALMLSLEDNALDETLETVRLARGQMALRALRREAREQGLDRLSMQDIDGLVAETRQS